MVWGSIGVVLLLAPLVRPSPAAAQAECSAADCRRQCYDDWLEDTISCETDDVSDLIADRQNCNANVVCNSFPSCQGTCAANLSAPGNSGKCALARSCSRSCRTNRGRLQGVCFKEFNRRLRTDCLTDSELRTAAQKARRECRRGCRKPADRITCPLPFDPGDFPDICSEPTTNSVCQRQCINGIVGSCYEKCAQACGGDQDALLVCQRVCRNGQCQRLQSQCVSEGADDGSSAGGSQSYQACCLASGTACDEDTTESVACVSTTTSTTSTSTTTVTTTTVVGSTTTTVVGGTTTTSTTISFM